MSRNSIEQLVDLLRRDNLRPPEAMPNPELPPMTFVCSVASEGADESEVAAIGECPEDLARFWRLARSARLFEDVTYGQWGIEILAPEEALAETDQFERERERDAVSGDLIVGRFIGDPDLLLMRCDPATSDFGKVIVAGAIDPRGEWDVVAESFREFLERYVGSLGEMYWVRGKAPAS